MLIRRLTVAGYRSLAGLTLPVERLAVFVGANGAGKTNLYRALQLLQAAAAGTLAREIAREGGMGSAVWAGPRKAKEPVRIHLGAAFDDLAYEVEIGLPRITDAAFPLEPQVKEERLTAPMGRRTATLLERRGPHATARDEEGRRVELGTDLMAGETALGALEDPGRYPDLHRLRHRLLAWRFYHDLRTDGDSPLRRPCLAVTAPTLASDGSDLAAVFATLAHIRGDTRDLDDAVADAFPGARLVVPAPERTARFGLIQPDFPGRVFEPNELSDGTLRFLALAGALLAYRLPPFIALNEPESSLHPALLDPLARLVARAAERTQVWVVTHSTPLADAIARHGGAAARTVVKREGATGIEGLTRMGTYAEE